MSHSPLPWHAERHKANDTSRDPDTGYWSIEAPILTRTGVVADTLNRDCAIDPEEDADNVEFIVRCCNNFDSLLAACKRMLTFEEWKNMLGDESRAACYLDALGKLRAAIAKATGKQP